MVKMISARFSSTIADWHAAWSRYHRARANSAPASKAAPIPISSRRTMSAVRGAAVPRKPASCIPAPQSSPGRSWKVRGRQSNFRSETALLHLPDDLAGHIHTAEESAEVPCQGHKRNPDGFDGQAITGQFPSKLAVCSHVDEPNYPDQQARSTAKYKMQQEDALEPLPFQLPLPGEHSGNQHRHRDHRRSQKIAVSCRSQNLPLRPLRQEIKRHARNKQGDRKMNQHHVLRVFGQQRRFDVEWMQGLFSLTARRLCRSSSGESSRNTDTFPLC